MFSDLSDPQGFMAWLVRKLKVKVTFDDNKLYASEILSILLQVTPPGLVLTYLMDLLIFHFGFVQNEPENRLLFGSMDALDSLLQQLAYYKRHDPAVAEEVLLHLLLHHHLHPLSGLYSAPLFSIPPSTIIDNILFL